MIILANKLSLFRKQKPLHWWWFGKTQKTALSSFPLTKDMHQIKGWAERDVQELLCFISGFALNMCVVVFILFFSVCLLPCCIDWNSTLQVCYRGTGKEIRLTNNFKGFVCDLSCDEMWNPFATYGPSTQAKSLAKGTFDLPSYLIHIGMFLQITT